MNINDYWKAMDPINPSNEWKERIMHKKATQGRYVPVRRILSITLTAVLMLAGVTSVTLAASPELSMAALSFFRMEEREQVPGQVDISQPDIDQTDADQPDISRLNISQTEIGNLVKAQYIKMDQRYGLSGDLLNNLTWSDDGRTLLEAEFWEIKDNNLVPIQVNMQTSQIDITFQGIHYQGNLYWFIRNGELCLFQGIPYGVDTRPEDVWSVEAIPGNTDVLLLMLAQGRQRDYTEYPMLFCLDTGETEDFLAGTGAEQLEYAYDYLWSENMRRVLILCSVGTDGMQEWLCDLDAGTLIRLDELTGMDEEVSAGFANNDTLILTTHTTSEEDETWQTVTCYAYDISTGQKTKTLDKVHYYRWWDDPYGAQLFGSRCVLISEDGQVRLVDLKTGRQTAVEGFTYQKGDKFMPSPSGNKLLYYSSDSKAEGLGISQLGVVDLERGTFIAFDREGYGNLYEEGIGWSNDSTASINARSSDGETRYLISYTF